MKSIGILEMTYECISKSKDQPWGFPRATNTLIHLYVDNNTILQQLPACSAALHDCTHITMHTSAVQELALLMNSLCAHQTTPVGCTTYNICTWVLCNVVRGTWWSRTQEQWAIIWLCPGRVTDNVIHYCITLSLQFMHSSAIYLWLGASQISTMAK